MSKYFKNKAKQKQKYFPLKIKHKYTVSMRKIFDSNIQKERTPKKAYKKLCNVRTLSQQE